MSVKIAAVEAYPLRLPMKRSFAISGGTVGNAAEGAPHVYVKITAEDGTVGWGEARPSPRWSYETPETVTSTVNRYFRAALVGRDAGDVRGALEALHREIANGPTGGQPIAKAAIDVALHDLVGRLRGQSLADMWQAAYAPEIQLSYLISSRDPEEAARMAADAISAGFRALDLKIGLVPERDVAMLEAVRAAAPDAYLRVDANQAYELPQAVRIAKAMERIGIDVFEQPLKANDLLGHAQLRRRTDVPIGLDESIWTPRDLLQAIRLEACDIAVIKLTKMSGLAAARRCGEIARDAGIGLLGGGLTESGLAFAASAHLFQYLGIDIPADLNGPFFLADDALETGPVIEGSLVKLPDGPGHGCTVSEVKLRQYSCPELEIYR